MTVRDKIPAIDRLDLVRKVPTVGRHIANVEVAGSIPVSGSMNTDQKGALAERVFDLEALRRGLTVSVPITPASYDRVLETLDGELVRVQVKYVDNDGPFHSVGAVTIRLVGVRNGKQSRNGYTAEEVDAIVAYMPKTEKLYWLGPDMFENKTAVTLRLEEPRNSQVSGIWMAEDYVWQ